MLFLGFVFKKFTGALLCLCISSLILCIVSVVLFETSVRFHFVSILSVMVIFFWFIVDKCISKLLLLLVNQQFLVEIIMGMLHLGLPNLIPVPPPYHLELHQSAKFTFRALQESQIRALDPSCLNLSQVHSQA